MRVRTNPTLMIVSREPLFTEEEARLVYTATGFYPHHLDLEKIEEWLSKKEKPASALINGFFPHGDVMLFEHNQPFLNTTTQSLIETAKGNLIDFSFISHDPEIVSTKANIYSPEDIRSILSFSKALLDKNYQAHISSPEFLDYLQSKEYIAKEGLELLPQEEISIDLSAHNFFYSAHDYRVKYLFPSGVSLANNFNEELDVLCGFKTGSSQPAEGYLAFDKAQVRQLQSENKPVVFATQNITLEKFDLISSACSGLIVCEEKEKGDAHLLEHLVGMAGLYFAEPSNGSELSVHENTLQYNSKKLRYGDHVVLDTKNKRLITAHATANTKEPYPKLSQQFIRVCDTYRTFKSGFKIYTNVSNPKDVEAIADLSTDGIGLVRTEYFFFTPEKLSCLKNSLAHADPKAILELQEHQQHNFTKLFNASPDASPFDITIRLLDPKPSELLSVDERSKLKEKANLEEDPRGVQLVQAVPELYTAQASAIFKSAQATNFSGDIKILVPFVSTGEEMKAARIIVENSAAQTGFSGQFQVGAMLETFNALAHIEDIVTHADFANIGPKDLTIEFLDGLRSYQKDEIETLLQERYGDRDDLPYHDEHPFEHLHSELKKKLEIALNKARKIKPDFEVTLCGDEVHKSTSSVAFALAHTQGISVPLNKRSLATTKLITCNTLLQQSTPT